MEMTNNDWKKKLTSPEEAVKLVHDHDRILSCRSYRAMPGHTGLHALHLLYSGLCDFFQAQRFSLTACSNPPSAS